MMIYTGITGGEKLDKIKELGLGVMISSSPVRKPTEGLNCVPCALDNGAFAAYSKGYPFQAGVFRDAMAAAYRSGLRLDFIVCPDIVCGGLDSLKFSLKWATGELMGAPNLALVVQNGMEPKHLTDKILKHFSHIFVGGDVRWKWQTSQDWVDFAHSKGKKCHIGRAGQLQYLIKAKEIGADSIDSTSFVINNSFHIIEQFRGQTQLRMFA